MTRPDRTTVVASLVSLTVLAGFLAMVPEGRIGMRASKTEGTAVEGGKEGKTGRGPVAVPPVDALRHPVTETATFSMG